MLNRDHRPGGRLVEEPLDGFPRARAGVIGGVGVGETVEEISFDPVGAGVVAEQPQQPRGLNVVVPRRDDDRQPGLAHRRGQLRRIRLGAGRGAVLQQVAEDDDDVGRAHAAGFPNRADGPFQASR